MLSFAVSSRHVLHPRFSNEDPNCEDKEWSAPSMLELSEPELQDSLAHFEVALFFYVISQEILMFTVTTGT